MQRMRHIRFTTIVFMFIFLTAMRWTGCSHEVRDADSTRSRTNDEELFYNVVEVTPLAGQVRNQINSPVASKPFKIDYLSGPNGRFKIRYESMGFSRCGDEETNCSPLPKPPSFVVERLGHVPNEDQVNALKIGESVILNEGSFQFQSIHQSQNVGIWVNGATGGELARVEIRLIQRCPVRLIEHAGTAEKALSQGIFVYNKKVQAHWIEGRADCYTESPP